MKLLDSLQQMPDGTTLVRWHLLDNNYQLIKPVERFLRFKQRGGSATGTIKTYAEKLQALWHYFEIKGFDWRNFELRHLAEFGYWYLTGGLLLDLVQDKNLRSRAGKGFIEIANRSMKPYESGYSTTANFTAAFSVAWGTLKLFSHVPHCSAPCQNCQSS